MKIDKFGFSANIKNYDEYAIIQIDVPKAMTPGERRALKEYEKEYNKNNGDSPYAHVG